MEKAAGENKLLADLAYNTGMRKMELAHARKQDLDPINMTIEVVEREDDDYEWMPKTPRGVRRIPIGYNLMAALLAMEVGVFWLFWAEHPWHAGHQYPRTSGSYRQGCSGQDQERLGLGSPLAGHGRNYPHEQNQTVAGPRSKSLHGLGRPGRSDVGDVGELRRLH